MAVLSKKTVQIVEKLFNPDLRPGVERTLLEECGNQLPGLREVDELVLERFRFAVLKLSQGKMVKLDQAVQLAKTDWRDLLMEAGFAFDVHAHEKWADLVLQ